MLIFDLFQIGNNLLVYRKKAGMSQAELAEAADISDRTYADIERGTANMRILTLLKICRVLKITPNDVLTEEDSHEDELPDFILDGLETCTPMEKKTALRLMSTYLNSIKR